jgi:hypothetical protein
VRFAGGWVAPYDGMGSRVGWWALIRLGGGGGGGLGDGVDRDEKALMATSIHLGMLTGDESAAMLNAHRTAGFAIGQPFVCVRFPSWVTLRARWVTLRARWVALSARWVTQRARWVTLRASLGDAKSSLGDG